MKKSPSYFNLRGTRSRGSGMSIPESHLAIENFGTVGITLAESVGENEPLIRAALVTSRRRQLRDRGITGKLGLCDQRSPFPRVESWSRSLCDCARFENHGVVVSGKKDPARGRELFRARSEIERIPISRSAIICYRLCAWSCLEIHTRDM